MKILGIPAINGLGKTIGTEKAPERIVEILRKEIFLSESGASPRIDFSQVSIDTSNLSITNQLIEQAVSGCEATPLIIGGDHSITYASFKAFSKKFKNPGIVVFDAHPDLENNFSPPTHEDYLRMLIEEGHVKSENVILVGTRSFDRNELDFMKNHKLHNFPMRKIAAEGLHDVSDSVMSIAKDFGAVYVSIDIDAIDPAFAPGTGYIEPGGLSSREFLHFLSRLKNLRNLKAFDLVEINPCKDANGMTLKLGAKIASEILDYSH